MRAPSLSQTHKPEGFLAKAQPYVALMKPRVIELLLVTTVPAMVLAEQRLPNWWLVLVTLFGGTLSAGGANAINMWYDRDIDSVMTRTERRPIVTGEVSQRAALVFGVSLIVVSTAVLWFGATPLAAICALAAALFYVFVYTMWLKRRSPQNIVIGGAAGAAPALVGWAAVTNQLSFQAWMMFAVVFFWTPPHFWALAIRYKDDYQAAKVPMMPNAKGEQRTFDEMVIYTVFTLVCQVLLGLVGHFGPLYWCVSTICGVWFLVEVLMLRRPSGQSAPMRVFGVSLVYLSALFVAIAIDGILRG